jgi:hypothetical protein
MVDETPSLSFNFKDEDSSSTFSYLMRECSLRLILLFDFSNNKEDEAGYEIRDSFGLLTHREPQKASLIIIIKINRDEI